MSVLDRATLEESTLADLHAIASELSIDSYRRLRKGDLIDTIIAHQGGEDRLAGWTKRNGRSQPKRAGRAEPEAATDEPEAAGRARGRRRRA